MEHICNTSFWDTQLTWNTSDPFFTNCFEETVITAIPCSFILLFFLVDVYYSIRKRTQFDNKITWLTVTKFVTTVTLIATHVVKLAVVIERGHYTSTVTYISSAIHIISYSAALALNIFSKYNMVLSSGIQFIFWLLACLCEAVLLRTAIRKYGSPTYVDDSSMYLIRIITFPLITIQLLVNFFIDGSTKQEHFVPKSCPNKRSSFVSKCLFLWYDGLAYKGYKGVLEYRDLWKLNCSEQAETQTRLFENFWKFSSTKKTRLHNSILPALAKNYGFLFLLGGFFKLLQDLFSFVAPEILKLLLAHVKEDSTEESWKGFFYAAILLISLMTQMFLGVQCNKLMWLIGLRVKSALGVAIYKKCLTVPLYSDKDPNSSNALNLLSVDTQKLMDFLPYAHRLWTSPIQIMLCIYFLYNILGNSIFAGVAVLLLLIPFNAWILSIVRKLQVLQVNLKDERVMLLKEVLSGIKVLKIYGWEDAFYRRIEAIRSLEIKTLKKIAFLNSTSTISFTCAPVLVTLSTFAIYLLSESNPTMDAERVFVSIALFNIMRMPLTMFPMVLSLLQQAAVSINRINAYMNSEEVNVDPSQMQTDNSSVSICNGTFKTFSDKTILTDINLNVTTGSLIFVVGSVGSGKNSLLRSILGEYIQSFGTSNVNGSLAFVAQEPWIQHTSVQENVLFYSSFVEDRYKSVIAASSLDMDITQFPNEDKTIIDEKSLNLSEGQKQRIALARAIYKDSDIYLLDDPFSALNSEVQEHIFENILGPNGLLKTKTRIIVTHDTRFFQYADEIVIMEDGKIIAHGAMQTLLKVPKFSRILLHKQIEKRIVNSDSTESSSDTEEKTSQGSSLSLSSEFQSTTSSTEQLLQLSAESKHCKTFEKSRKSSNINFKLIVNYIESGRKGLCVVAVLSTIISVGFSIYSNIWLSQWTSTDGENDKNSTNKSKSNFTSISVYGVLGLGQGVTIVIATIALAYATLQSAASIHTRSLNAVLTKSLEYFGGNSFGRLVNRFSKDMDIVDNNLPITIRESLVMTVNAVATIIVISCSTPTFLIFIIPCGVFYAAVQRFYIATTRQLKRMEASSRSPIYSFLDESIDGACTIRAFNLQKECASVFQKAIDFNQRAYYPFVTSNLWISVRLEGLGCLIVFAVASRNSISPATVGLSVSYALQITQILNVLVRQLSELETNLISVERMEDVSRKNKSSIKTATTAQNSVVFQMEPEHSGIEFRNYYAKYNSESFWALENVTCKITSGEKIGVVGRTGAGKSSFILALFNLIEPYSGNILIGEHDISTISDSYLRSKLTIIPQDPVLFSGTLRFNLDPYSQFEDEEIWKCIEASHLKKLLDTFSAGLQWKVSDSSSTLSVGQKQQVCLARALLRKTDILILDEITAGMDKYTEDLIQKTIQKEFSNATVVTVAHRLSSIINCDRILVLDAGRLIEFDTPSNLLKNSQSLFHAMVTSAGL